VRFRCCVARDHHGSKRPAGVRPRLTLSQRCKTYHLPQSYLRHTHFEIHLRQQPTILKPAPFRPPDSLALPCKPFSTGTSAVKVSDIGRCCPRKNTAYKPLALPTREGYIPARTLRVPKMSIAGVEMRYWSPIGIFAALILSGCSTSLAERGLLPEVQARRPLHVDLAPLMSLHDDSITLGSIVVAKDGRVHLFVTDSKKQLLHRHFTINKESDELTGLVGGMSRSGLVPAGSWIQPA